MKQWQYFLVTFRYLETLGNGKSKVHIWDSEGRDDTVEWRQGDWKTFMNKMGSNGWELAAVKGDTYYFKRELQ